MFGLLLGLEVTGHVIIENRLTNLLLFLFSSFFFPFGPYRFTSTASSKPRRSRCSLLFSFRSMLSTGSFWCVMGSSTWPVCCSHCSGRPIGDRDSSITTGKVKYQPSGLGTCSQLIFNAIPCFRAPEVSESSARKFARLKLLLLFSFCFDWNNVSNTRTVFHLLSKHLDFRQKYPATRRIFTSLFAYPDETLSLVFHMLREG